MAPPPEAQGRARQRDRIHHHASVGRLPANSSYRHRRRGNRNSSIFGPNPPAPSAELSRITRSSPPERERDPSEDPDWQARLMETLNTPRIINGLWHGYQDKIRSNEVELRELRARAGVERASSSVPAPPSHFSSTSSSSSWTLPSIPEHPSQDESQNQREGRQGEQRYPSQEQIFREILISDMYPHHEPPAYAAYIWDVVMTIYERQVAEIRALQASLGLEQRYGNSFEDSGHGSMSIEVRSGPDRERGEDGSNWAPVRIVMPREDGGIVSGLQRERQGQQERDGGTGQSASVQAEADADALEEGATASWQWYRYGDGQDEQGRSERDGGKPDGGRTGPCESSGCRCQERTRPSLALR